MLCGGVVDVFFGTDQFFAEVDDFWWWAHLILSILNGKKLGFYVTIIDDRPEFASAKRFPKADGIAAEDFSHAIQRLEITSSSYIVIVTRDHLHDAMFLEWAATTSAAYVGMVGSKKKVRDVFGQLEMKGTTSDLLACVHAPIGLAIDAASPEETAVSIMAKIIQIRKQPEGAKQGSDLKSNS